VAFKKIDRKKLLDKPKGTSKNDITGDYMRTKTPSKKYKDNYDKIDWTKK
jgi:hypothetical protein